MNNCFVCKKDFTKDNPSVIIKQGKGKILICKRHPYPEDIVIKED